ncbi:hypothetical protein M8R20_05930 [Pseudomonas sp. R2.Fl]|nr:hypothetical protein [Pseudomonas sp. R2.Fl]
MRSRGVVVLSSISGAGLAAVATLGMMRPGELPADPFISGSIPRALTPAFVAPPAQFSVTNLVDMTVCLVERGGSLTSRSRSFRAPEDCAMVWPGLVEAANWIENGDGTVTLSDGSGDVVLTLGRARGFSYEALDMDGLRLAWLMLP